MFKKIIKLIQEDQRKAKENRKKFLEAWNQAKIETSGLQCPRCDSKNLKILEPSFMKKSEEASLQLLTLGIRKPTKPLNVCRSCGFSWEPR
jgi:DNA-directed RNA polymerase subunit RPC12/RpoP